MGASSETERAVVPLSEGERSLGTSVIIVERVYGRVRITTRYEAVSTTNKPIIYPTKSLERPINNDVLFGTHLPEQFQYRLGAFVTLLFSDPKISRVEIKQIDNGEWIVDAVIKTARRQRNRRGEGETPVEAFANLVVDIYG
jgi:hypothetical protein